MIGTLVDMTTTEAEEAVRVLLVRGRILHAGDYTCGPVWRAGDREVSRWAVLAHGPIFDRASEREADDWWLIASWFVKLVGPFAAARAALHAADRALDYPPFDPVL